MSTATASQLVQVRTADAARGLLHHMLRAHQLPAVAVRWSPLVWNFFRRELLGRCHGSYLGVGWVLVRPMFMFAVYYAIFGVFLGPRGTDGGVDSTFPFYLFAGFIVYSTIVDGTNNALRCVVANHNLVKKVTFPCELLPVSPVLSSLVVYLVGTSLLLVAGSAAGQLKLGIDLVAWPVLLVIMLTFSLGLGLLLACCYVFIRDLGELYGIVTTAFFFLSSIFWYPSLVAVKVPLIADAMPFVNPVYCLIMAQRQIFGVVPPSELALLGTLPENLAIAAAFALLFFAFGYGVFMSRKHKFADQV